MQLPLSCLLLKIYAKRVERKFSIPYKLILAVSALESNWGRSGLSRKYNNYFGRKAIGSQPYGRMLTKEYRKGRLQTEYARFRAYSTAEDSFSDFASLITTNNRYSNLSALSKEEEDKWAIELARAGYATDPGYANKIISIYRKF